MANLKLPRAMTDEQRALVDNHLWLIKLHIARRVPAAWRRGRACSWEDLYQEGCLGLIDAAQRFEPARGIPFISFALPRIHTAVSRFLWQRANTVRQPRTKRPSGESSAPLVFSLDSLCGGSSALAAPDAQPDAGLDSVTAKPASQSVETVGQRLGVLFERAVHQAVDREGQGRARRADRGRLLRRIAEERLLIPSEEHRVSLRTIARETDSSIARVVQCEHRLRERIREALADDPEVEWLREVARRDPAGMAVPLDDALVRELRDVVERRFMTTFFHARPEERTEMLTRLMECCGRRLGEVVRGLYASLPREQQDEFLSQTRAIAG